MPNQVQKYMNKISGPLMDRIDIQVEIEPVEFDDMANRAPAESSAEIRKRVMTAREIQQARFRDLPGIHCNAQMSGKQLRQFAWPDEAGLKKLKDRMTKLNRSARAFDRILRVARTIADLESAASLPPRSGSEAHGGVPGNISGSSSSQSSGSGEVSAEYIAALTAAVSAPVEARHIAEAIGYRALDRPSNLGIAF